MREFNISASISSELSATTLVAVLICIPFAGIMIDRFSPKKLIVSTLFFSCGGIALLALSHSLLFAFIARFITGIGSAFCFLTCIRLASKWFPANYLSIVVGVLVAMATTGGMVAQKPAAELVSIFGWRSTLWIDSLLGLFIILWIYIFVRDKPNTVNKNKLKKITSSTKPPSMLNHLKQSYLNIANWNCGFYTSFINLPFWILGASWGIPFLTQTKSFTSIQAADVTSMLYLGIIFGSPCISLASKYINNRSMFMSFGALTLSIMLLILIYESGFNKFELEVLYFTIGFFTGIQVLTYPIVAESNPQESTAASVSVVSFVTMGGGVASQLLFGYLMDKFSSDSSNLFLSIYPQESYTHALLILPIAALASLALAFIIKPTSKVYNGNA